MSCSPGLQELQWEAVAQAAGMTIHAISVLNQGRCCAGWWALIQGFHHALLKHHKPTREKNTHILSSGCTVGPPVFARLTAVGRLQGILSVLLKEEFIVDDRRIGILSVPCVEIHLHLFTSACIEHFKCCQMYITRENKTNGWREDPTIVFSPAFRKKYNHLVPFICFDHFMDHLLNQFQSSANVPNLFNAGKHPVSLCFYMYIIALFETEV